MLPSEVEQLKQCPFCGEEHPWVLISAFTAVLRCPCGAEFAPGSVGVLYKKDQIPPDLLEHASPANAYAFKQADGSILSWPEHGYYGINIPAAFAHAGITSKWNRRA